MRAGIYPNLNSLRVKKTNADKIRAMSDDELAKMIICPYNSSGYRNPPPCSLSKGKDCNECIKEWLKKEAEGS